VWISGNYGRENMREILKEKGKNHLSQKTPGKPPGGGGSRKNAKYEAMSGNPKVNSRKTLTETTKRRLSWEPLKILRTKKKSAVNESYPRTIKNRRAWMYGWENKGMEREIKSKRRQ